MALKPRVHLPGGVYPVMLRRNGGQDISPTDEIGSSAVGDAIYPFAGRPRAETPGCHRPVVPMAGRWDAGCGAGLEWLQAYRH